MSSADEEVEVLARPEHRAELPLRRLLWLYLNPFALLKNVSVGPPRLRAEALRYNRARRGMLLLYLRRWAAIGAACLMAELPVATWAAGSPVLGVTFIGLELGFAFAVCVLLLAGAVYVLLGFDELD
ncbi:MAG TPA: hypothetical protein VE935_12175 [Burkholderiales bacterium]|jgi:hypothetical protein|nr:hypothetical protein [Burkholderiales bacterium]